MNFYSRIASFEVAVLRVKGRVGKSKREGASVAEIKEVLAELDALIRAHRAEFSPRESRQLGRLHREMTRRVSAYDAPPSVRERLVRLWARVSPLLRKPTAAPGSN
jgi:hypothetical protein